MMKRIVLTILLTIITLTVAVADEISFVTSAPKAVEVNQNFRLKYTVNRRNVKEPLVPAMDNFRILSGPGRSESSSTSIINGVVTSTQSVTFTYILLAEKEGEFKIPGATISVDGKDYTSNTITVKVLPQDQSAAQSSATQQRRGGQRAASAAEISANDLFMTATLNKTNVFEQEAVLLTFKVYSAVNLTSLNGKGPDLKGFQIQEVELPQNKEWQMEHYKGRNYRTLVWQQYVLFPQQSGEIEIPSASFEGVVAQPVQSYNDFYSFFGGTNYVEVKRELRTPKLKLNVQRLPANKPEGFSGAVGSFKISSSVSTTELKANEAVTLRLIISGTGNMKLIKTPEVNFPEDFEIYDPKIENKFSLKNNGFTGNKIIEYLAIPRYGGQYTIPSVKFSYFDINSKEYRTLETESYTLQVEKGKENAGAVAAYVSKEELKLIGQDIRYIKRDNAQLSNKGEYLFASLTYWLCYIIPLLLFVAYIVLHRKQMAANANIAATRTKKANKVAVKRLKMAQKLLKDNKKNEFYDEILKTLWGYMSDKLNIPVSQLSKENIATELTERGVDETLISELHSLLNEGEFARYAPGDAGATMDNVYNMAIKVISKMENSIKR